MLCLVGINIGHPITVTVLGTLIRSVVLVGLPIIICTRLTIALSILRCGITTIGIARLLFGLLWSLTVGTSVRATSRCLS